MSNFTLIACSVLYLIILFLVGYFAEAKANTKKSITNNPYVYALSLAIYCTAWTFFGSVGRATTTGIEFIYTYLGPTIMAPLFWIVLRKIIRISKTQRITSIADFISTRYGKNVSLGVIVSLLCVLGIIPYIAIQLKAISASINIISFKYSNTVDPAYNDIALFIAGVLAVFVIFFGTRSVDTTEKHEGMVAAVAFESLVKLVAFIAVGVFVCYFVFNGFGDIIQQASAIPKLQKLFVVPESAMYLQLFSTMVLSMFAILFLPRQFQIAVVENVQEKHLNKAMWLFPLYLFLINLFVLPIAFGGTILFSGSDINPDTYVLSIPLWADQTWLTLLVYIGGFSAASSMIIVETIALSTMISNNIVMPLLLSMRFFKKAIDKTMHTFVINSRRISIILILFLAYIYERNIAEKFSLVSIGLISFTAVAQFAPSIIGGIFWKQANKNAALISILVGFGVWFYTLVIPYIVAAGMWDSDIVQAGLGSNLLLKPTALFGMTDLDTITHGALWSLLLNTLCFITLSLFTRASPEEIYQAELFVDVYKHPTALSDANTIWKRTAFYPELKRLVSSFIGERKTTQLFESYAAKKNIVLNNVSKAEPQLVNFSEKILAGAIGSASARIIVKSVVEEEDISIDQVLNILRESQTMKEMNKELRKKSLELSKATQELQKVNAQLKEMDEIKDEFLYTVTHELRTPLTSIRALSEILLDNPDLPQEKSNEYLEAITKETIRLSHLLSQVLNLEKYESGRTILDLSYLDLNVFLHEIIVHLKPLLKEKNIAIKEYIQPDLPPICADKDLLQQVIYNLLSNAIKFARTNIIVDAFSSENKFIITIQDDGVGIAQDLHELIFDKFFQAKNQTLKKPEGTGLGLSICKKIIGMHNGKIWVESDVNKGATFIIELIKIENITT